MSGAEEYDRQTSIQGRWAPSDVQDNGGKYIFQYKGDSSQCDMIQMKFGQ